MRIQCSFFWRNVNTYSKMIKNIQKHFNMDGIVRINVIKCNNMIFVSYEHKKEAMYGNTIFRNCSRRRLAGSFL